jgi:hypothetical protein
MTWEHYRRYRHALWPVVLLATLVMRRWPAHPASVIAAVTAGLCVVFYLAGEVAWNWQGLGRPCPDCGGRVPMRSFHVHALCPHCGQTL